MKSYIPVGFGPKTPDLLKSFACWTLVDLTATETKNDRVDEMSSTKSHRQQQTNEGRQLSDRR